MPPELESSTAAERETFIKETYKCRVDCDSCGICVMFHNKDPLIVFRDYIEGIRGYMEILQEYRY